MGLFAVDCPYCAQTHLWFSGSPYGQLCKGCIDMLFDREKPSPELGGLRPKVHAFALLMEEKLAKNDHKPHWKKDGLSVTYEHFMEEVQELREEILGACRVKEACFEAADVACMAMMIADCLGGLQLREPA